MMERKQQSISGFKFRKLFKTMIILKYFQLEKIKIFFPANFIKNENMFTPTERLKN